MTDIKKIPIALNYIYMRCLKRAKAKEETQFSDLVLLKVRNVQKQLVLFSCLPKNERKSCFVSSHRVEIRKYFLFVFGGNKNKIICF